MMNRQSSAIRGPWSIRSGISLMEVLISIGIVAVGLVSIAALIPVGGIQAQKAGIEQRKAELGMNVFLDFKTRGFGVVDPPANCPWVRYNGTNWIAYFPPFPPAAADQLPVAIDPLMVAAAGTGGAATITQFPANAGPGPPPTMRRLTLSTAATFVNPNFTPYLPLADTIFRAADDIVVDQSGDLRFPGQSIFLNDTSARPLRRDSSGQYSWLATLTPFFPDQVIPAAGLQCTLSVAVCYRRSLPNPTSDPSTVREGTATVTVTGAPYGTNDYVSIGGGDMRFTVKSGTYSVSNPNPLSYARPGSWLMLCRDQPWTIGADTGTMRVFKWYRVVTCDLIDETSQVTTQNVTVAGPDWVFSKGNTQPSYACLFDGIVAVYQRTIQLEGPSEWTQ